jgi:hypothetical protein
MRSPRRRALRAQRFHVGSRPGRVHHAATGYAGPTSPTIRSPRCSGSVHPSRAWTDQRNCETGRRLRHGVRETQRAPRHTTQPWRFCRSSCPGQSVDFVAVMFVIFVPDGGFCRRGARPGHRSGPRQTWKRRVVAERLPVQRRHHKPIADTFRMIDGRDPHPTGEDSKPRRCTGGIAAGSPTVGLLMLRRVNSPITRSCSTNMPHDLHGRGFWQRAAFGPVR